MPFFQPMRDFFHRQQAKKLNVLYAGLELVIERSESQRGHFVFPGDDTIARIEHHGVPIGEVDYGINPFGDRLYINMIEIQPAFRFRGLAMATLWRLWQLHQLPITPLGQRLDATLFWAKARKRFAAAGTQIEAQLSHCEMERAKGRWAHLIPESGHEQTLRQYGEWVASEHAAGRPAGPGIK